MSLFGNKTKYYVNSSSCPLFQQERRVHHYAAATLDYTANSSVDQSEYMKGYFDYSSTKNLLTFKTWWERKGFHNIFGKNTATFYSDPKIDLAVVTSALTTKITLEEGQSLSVIDADLNFFSEDFWILHEATKQGLIEQVSTQLDTYTLSKNGNAFTATFGDGLVLQGTFPHAGKDTRFMEISYVLIKETRTKWKVITKTDGTKVTYLASEAPEPLEGETVEVTYTVNTDTDYGYYHYQYATGIPELDAIFKESGITAGQTFLPVIPLRTNTAWYTGTKARYINEALLNLGLFADPKRQTKDRYGEVKKVLTEGINKSGKLSDIDYITLIPSVALNSTNNADCKYMYTFFDNIRVNYGMREFNSDIAMNIPISGGLFSSYIKKLLSSVISGSLNRYKSFTITCASSNVNLTYKWASNEYIEANGQFKPNAKPGHYGVLTLIHHHRYVTNSYDGENHLIRSWEERQSYEYNSGGEWFTGTRYVWYYEYDIPYEITLFCRQHTANRWRAVVFVDLHVVNLIYHGKSIDSWPWEAITESEQTARVTHYIEDGFSLPSANSKPYTFTYPTVANDLDSGFMIPLETGTLYEIGLTDLQDLSSGYAYLLVNAWVKKKIKWYRRGIFGIIVGVVLIVVGVITQQYYLVGIGAAFIAASIVIKVLELIQKILTSIFGEKIGGVLATIVKIVVVAVLTVCTYGYFGIAFAAAYAMETSLQSGDAFGKALAKGVVAAVAAYGAQGISDYVSGAVAEGLAGTALQASASTIGSYAGAMAAGFVTGFANGLVEGSFKDALVSGFIGAAAGGVSLAVSSAFSGSDVGQSLQDSPDLSQSADAEAYKVQMLNSDLGSPNPDGTSALTKPLTISQHLASAIKNTLQDPQVYLELLSVTQEERFRSKMANLENDYKEFNEQYQAALDFIDVVNSYSSSTVLGEFITKVQTNLSRYREVIPEASILGSPDTFLSMATFTDIPNACTSGVTAFTMSKLSMDGFSPATFHAEFTNFGVDVII